MRRFAAACVLLAGGCRSGGFHDGVFSKPGVRYVLSAPDDGWKPLSVDDGDVAWMSPPHTIAVDSTCSRTEDAPLQVLTNHLLMGFTERQRLTEALEQLDGREALHSRYDAKLDGVPVELELVVMKKDGCVYDFVYTSPPGRGEEKRQVFQKLLSAFKTEPTT
jgi:hypothetical protein